jgi:hypothetical protein
MKQDTDCVTISESFDPNLLFKLIEKFVLKQSDNQYKTAVLIAEQLSILQFRQDDQLGNATYYDCFTTRVEVARQAGVCCYSPDLLEDKATQLKIGGYDTLSDTDKKKVIDSVKQDVVAGKASRAEKDVANDYSKGNINAYPSDIHKALTLMNEHKLLKVDTPVVPAQGTAFVTNSQGGKKKGEAKTKYLIAEQNEWNALSPEAQSKIIDARKKSNDNDEDDKSLMTNKSAKTIINSISKMMKSLEKDNRWLKKLVSALQKREEKTFDLCCNKTFASKMIKAENALLMMSNGGGLQITKKRKQRKKCKTPGYKYLVWYSKKAIMNIICLKNLIKCYRVTYDNEMDTTSCVPSQAFGLPDLLFEMHPCGVHICYPKKMGEFGFVQTVEDNMKLFSKRQIAGVVQAGDLYEKLIYPSTSDFRSIVSVGGSRGWM